MNQRRSARNKILIVDDHPLVQRGLRQLFDESPDLCAPWAAPTSVEALDLVCEHDPDLAIVDVSLEKCNGIELVKQLHAHYPDLPVLVVSMHDEMLYTERALAAGARGYIMKQASDDEMLQAVRDVLDNKLYVSQTMRQQRAASGQGGVAGTDSSTGEASPVDRLSDRELEVFLLLGQGFAPRHIADKLSVSVKTVESHRRQLKSKLNIESSSKLTRFAIEWSKTRGTTESSRDLVDG
jgi:DNA-binding NarL/FixJ family response regulator